MRSLSSKTTLFFVFFPPPKKNFVFCFSSLLCLFVGRKNVFVFSTYDKQKNRFTTRVKKRRAERRTYKIRGPTQTHARETYIYRARVERKEERERERERFKKRKKNEVVFISKRRRENNFEKRVINNKRNV